MKYAGIKYEAFGEKGAYWRDAQTVNELPRSVYREALDAATSNIEKMISIPRARPSIAFGIPVYEFFGMRPADAKRHAQSKLLLTRGCDIPLTYCS